MYHVVFAQIIHAEREREIEAAIRRHQLLRPQEDPNQPLEATERRPDANRTLAPRVRPTGG